MRNLFAFVFWYVVLVRLLGACALAYVSFDAVDTLSDAEWGYRAGRLLGIWWFVVPFFVTFFGWYHGYLPLFRGKLKDDSGGEKSDLD